jgi:hypothetical protein
MKRLLIGIAILFACSPAYATIARQQSAATFGSGPGTTCSKNFTTSPAVGDLIVVSTSWTLTTATVTSVTDSVPANSYVSAVGPTTLGVSQRAQIFYAINTGTNSPFTVTATFSASITCNLVIADYSGVDTGSPLDVTAAATGTTQNLNSGSATPNFVNELVFGAAWTSGGTLSQGTGFNLVQNNAQVLTEDSVLVSNAVQQTTASNSGTGHAWIMQMVTFRDAADSWNGALVPATLNGAIEVGGNYFPANGAGLQNAINYTGTVQGSTTGPAAYGGKVVLPCGSITLNSTITINAPVVLEGCGGSIGATNPITGAGEGAPGTKLIWAGTQSSISSISRSNVSSGITTISRSSGIVTVTTSSSITPQTYALVVISGITGTCSNLNTTEPIMSGSGTTFKYQLLNPA